MKETVDLSLSHIEQEQLLVFFESPPKDKRNIRLETDETCMLHQGVMQLTESSKTQ